jgi:hypothetical protein
MRGPLEYALNLRLRVYPHKGLYARSVYLVAQGGAEWFTVKRCFLAKAINVRARQSKHSAGAATGRFPHIGVTRPAYRRNG